MGTGLAIAAVASTVIGTGVSIAQQQSAQKKQKKANDVAQATEEFKAKRERIRGERRNRIKQADQLAQGAVSGTSTSSSLAGSVGSLNTQNATGVGVFNTLNGARATGIGLQQSAQRSLNRAKQYQQLGELGGDIFTQASKIAKAHGH